jgi:arsenate reductase
MTEPSDRIQLAFVCVQNAGRSQMAYAFAQRNVSNLEVSDRIDLVTGGTRPADCVHDEVVRAMSAVGIDISDRTPREVTFEEIQQSDYVITMGCSADDICPAGWAGQNRDWNLDDPDGQSAAEVGRIRDEIEERVNRLISEVSSRH